MIYAIRAVGTEYIKIGKANSVGRRLKELEVASPFELHIEAVADWPDDEERRLHIYLRPHYVRGEWFKDGETLTHVIELLRRETGLGEWQAICAERRIQAARTVSPMNAKPSEARKLKAMAKYERRLRERRQWWADRLKQGSELGKAAISKSTDRA